MATAAKGIGRNNACHLSEIVLNLAEMEQAIRRAARKAEDTGEFDQKTTSITYLKLFDLISRTKTEADQIKE